MYLHFNSENEKECFVISPNYTETDEGNCSSYILNIYEVLNETKEIGAIANLETDEGHNFDMDGIIITAKNIINGTRSTNHLLMIDQNESVIKQISLRDGAMINLLKSKQALGARVNNRFIDGISIRNSIFLMFRYIECQNQTFIDVVNLLNKSIKRSAVKCWNSQEYYAILLENCEQEKFIVNGWVHHYEQQYQKELLPMPDYLIAVINKFYSADKIVIIYKTTLTTNIFAYSIVSVDEILNDNLAKQAYLKPYYADNIDLY